MPSLTLLCYFFASCENSLQDGIVDGLSDGSSDGTPDGSSDSEILENGMKENFAINESSKKSTFEQILKEKRFQFKQFLIKLKKLNHFDIKMIYFLIC